MKVTFQTCCGVDVHKSFLVATIIKTSSGIEPSYQKRRFSTFNNSILEFKKWLLENECLYVCMESTGKYWIPVFNLLEDEINVTIANPKWVKAVKGNKDDTKDSKWIGDLFRLGLVRGSYIPCKKIRILREFTRYRYKLVSCRSSEKNRQCFEFCTINGVVLTNIYIVCIRADRKIGAIRNIGECLILRRCDLVCLSVFLCLLPCFLCPLSCNDIICHSVLHQVHGDHGKLLGSTALQEQHFIIVRNVHQIPKILLCVL